MEFVVNEWLPEYFNPDENEEHRIQLYTFISKFLAKKDKIFIIKPSPFLNKLYRFEKKYFDPELRKRASFFIYNIIENSDKCVEIIGDIELPPNILELLSKGNFASDIYLFEAALQSDSRKIITTDEKLIKHFSNNGIFELLLLEDFLKEY